MMMCKKSYFFKGAVTEADLAVNRSMSAKDLKQFFSKKAH